MKPALLVVIALVLAACVNAATATPTPDPLDAGRRFVGVDIGDARFTAILSDTPEPRAVGLSGREALGRGRAMWFDLGVARPVRFWMKEMRFAIDIVWVSEALVVVDVTRDAPVPDAGTTEADLPRYSPEGDALVRYVLEIAAGQALRLGIQRGDAVTVSP